MNDADARIIKLLEDIVQNQNLHLTHQAELLALQKSRHLTADLMTQRAEALQESSAKLLYFLGLIALACLAWLFLF